MDATEIVPARSLDGRKAGGTGGGGVATVKDGACDGIGTAGTGMTSRRGTGMASLRATGVDV
jgi:hypothetical protein